MSWVIGEIIKISGDLDSFNSLMEVITDMLMGVMGLDAVTVWIKAKEDYKYFTRTISNGNIFEEKRSNDLPEYLLRLKEAAVFDMGGRRQVFLQSKNVQSILLVPLDDFKKDQRIGLIVGEHHSAKYFTNNKIDFFKTLAIQISITAKNSTIFEKVSEMSTKDMLTNCYNRKYLDKLMLNMNSSQSTYSLAVFDMDNFKSVNDTLGHEKGDDLLVVISNLAIEYANKYHGDVIRYGGDEFIVILFNPLEESFKILDDFRKAFINLPYVKNLGIPVTVTIGLASYPETVSNMNHIFSIADKALLKAKKEGKNKVQIGYSSDLLEENA